MEPLRIAMIIQHYPPHMGGAERQLAVVAKGLAAEGAQVCVLTRKVDDAPYAETVDGVTIRRIPVPGPKPVASLSFTAGALPVLLRWRPDVIHAHELLSPATTALAGKMLLGVPVLAKILRGGLLGDIAKLRRSASGRMRLDAIRRRVDAFTVISREIDEELRALGVPEERRVFIPNGVDLARFHPAATAERSRLRESLGLPDVPIALFSGRVEPEKRIDRLIALWPEIRAAVPGALLVVAGSGSEEDRLRAAAREAVGEGVRFVGYVPDMVPWYRAADAFVLPSTTEGLSNALLEAMASGLVCVATAVGGTVDVIRPGRTGLLIDPGDERELVSSLIAALSSEEARRIAAEARAQMVDDYSLDGTIRKLHALYGRLAGPRPGAWRTA
ncbi:glycosyltransferase family 4 protein [Azospirillum sp. sgz302134]